MTQERQQLVSWERIRADAIKRGQITEEGVAAARREQDAYVAGYRLAELRKRVGATQAGLARVTGVSQARLV